MTQFPPTEMAHGNTHIDSHCSTRMDTGGRSVNNSLGYFYAKDVPRSMDNYKWGFEFLQLRNSKPLVVCLIARVKSSKFFYTDNQGNEHINNMQILKFLTLRPADTDALNYLVFGLQKPPAGVCPNQYFGRSTTDLLTLRLDAEDKRTFRASKFATKRGEDPAQVRNALTCHYPQC